MIDSSAVADAAANVTVRSEAAKSEGLMRRILVDAVLGRKRIVDRCMMHLSPMGGMQHMDHRRSTAEGGRRPPTSHRRIAVGSGLRVFFLHRSHPNRRAARVRRVRLMAARGAR